MTRGSRALTSLYALTALWLAYVAWTTQGHVPPWTSILMAAASLVPIIGVVRELVIFDARRELAIACEREGRRAAWRDQEAEHLAAAELNQACCERWWTSFGTDHDPECEHQTPRSSAA